MKRLVEIRNQEFICRERASLDSERRMFWLAKAEEWEQCALDEIAFHFRECNRDPADLPTGTPTISTQAGSLIVALNAGARHRSARAHAGGEDVNVAVPAS